MNWRLLLILVENARRLAAADVVVSLVLPNRVGEIFIYSFLWDFLESWNEHHEVNQNSKIDSNKEGF